MRMVFMAYITGTIKAVDFYCRAFNAKTNCFKSSDDEEFYAHAEMYINDQTILAIGEKPFNKPQTADNNMQFWVTFDDEQSLTVAYDVLKEDAEIHWELAPNDWCKNAADLTDKYGIRWLLNIF